MLWLKSFHLFAVVCWFAGIFYLPRLFVYHAMAEAQPIRDQFKVMERKLFRFMTGLAVVAIALGTALVLQNPDYYLRAGWLHAKLALVLLLVVYHAYCGVLVRRFAGDDNRRGHRFYRWFNEAPVPLLLGAVLLAVLKPF